MKVIQQVHSASRGGKCSGHLSHLAGCATGHSDWEVVYCVFGNVCVVQSALFIPHIVR